MAYKTKKTITKRFRLTKRGKIMHRKSGQDHFNSRESGTVTRRKRRDVHLTKALRKTLKHFVQ